MSPFVHIERRIHASPETLFDAWISPESLAVFLCPAPGVRTVDIQVDARVGGAFSLVMLAGESRIPVRGEYLAVDRPHRLEFTWLSARTTGVSTVVLRFEPDGSDTILTLEHRGFLDEASRSDHDGGWKHILDCQQVLLASS
ncbi:MAG: hypothetical protein ACI9VR_003034 [Cognaticolwellia sp.]|jgi:uncharacterized protein YndB with AHSA1/START domain